MTRDEEAAGGRGSAVAVKEESRPGHRGRLPTAKTVTNCNTESSSDPELADGLAWLHVIVRDGQRDADLRRLLLAVLDYVRRAQNLVAPQ
ncbi:MAG: hypothetical protein O7A71_11485 [Chloroflexi bacterium]|nr:hypothetical protein [Chloroflexota bacterium]